MTRKQVHSKVRRRWWQRLLRWSVFAWLLLLAAYVSIPWWLPRQMLRRQIAEDLSSQMGVDVQIGQLDVSWGRGVEIRDLVIASPESFGPEPVVRIPLIRADFAPLTYLVRSRIHWMEIQEPVLSVRIDSEGNANTAVLQKMRSDVKTGRTSVRQAKVTVEFPDEARVLVVQVSDLQYIAGRVEHLARLTVSARLKQEDYDAPVSLILDPGTQHAAARASFHFSHVDLQQLGLEKLLGLPVRSLKGRCGGSLELRFNRETKTVDQADCDLSLRNLDVQPLDERVTFPVFDEAGVGISAKYDPYDPSGQRVDVQALNVHLPGIVLSGKAVLFAEALAGNWQGIQDLQLEGSVDPGKLALLTTGSASLANDVHIDGPVRLGLRLQHRGATVQISGHTDATATRIVQADETLKTAGKQLRVEIDGSLDDRSWQFDLKDWRLKLASNEFWGKGQLPDMRDLLLADTEAQTKPQLSWSDVLSQTTWTGEMRLRDLDSLRRMLKPLGVSLGDVELEGMLQASLWVTQRDGLRMQSVVMLDQDTKLTLGGRVIKDPGNVFRIRSDATLSRDMTQVQDVELAASLGQASFVLEGGKASLLNMSDKADQQELELSGHFELKNAQDFIAPQLGKSAESQVLAGTVRGSCLARIGTQAQRLRLDADLTQLEINQKGIFRKPAGMRAQGYLDFLRDTSLAASQRNVVRCGWRSPKANLETNVTFGSAFNQQGLRLECTAQIFDAAWLAELFPAVSDSLDGGSLDGPLLVRADATWRMGQLSTDLQVDADGVNLRIGGENPRSKLPDIPLRLRLIGSLRQGDGQTYSATLNAGAMDLGDTRLRLSGQAVLAIPRDKGSFQILRPSGLKEFDGKIEGTLACDDTIERFVPELVETLSPHKIRGSTEVMGTVRVDGQMLHLKGTIDASKVQYRNNGRLIKPAGENARVAMELRIPNDLSQIRVLDLQLATGPVHVLAGGMMQLNGRKSLWPTEVVGSEFHASIWTRQASQLHRFVPQLKPYELEGDALIEAEWQGGEEVVIRNLLARCEQLKGRYNGRKVRLSGDLQLSNLRRQADGQWVLDGLGTDSLEFQAEKNHMWVIADVRNLSESPKGKVQLLASYIDDKDMSDWLGGVQAQPEDGPPVPPKPLDEAELRATATKAIAAIRDVFKGADLDVSARIQHLHTWDPSVGYYYDARNVYTESSVQDGRIKLAYAAGISGGMIRGGLEVSLNEEKPVAKMWKELRDAYAIESIQAQMLKFFPGNMVEGFFNRNEKIKVDLVNLIANMIDPRSPLKQVGLAKTVAVEGITRGRAAPKFVTRLFPGLNLTSYRYNKMTGFSEYLADGTAVSDMIFDGQAYDAYIEGTTDIHNIARYELGLILLGTPQSAEWNHVWRQGRLPLLKFKARIEDGVMHDLEVSYPWPNESLGAIFLKNNVLYRAWLKSRQEK